MGISVAFWMLVMLTIVAALGVVLLHNLFRAGALLPRSDSTRSKGGAWLKQ